MTDANQHACTHLQIGPGEYCYEAEGLADIGIIAMEGIADAESRTLSQDVGVCRMLLEGKYLYDMLDPECDFSKYKLLILPDTIIIKGELGEKIKSMYGYGQQVVVVPNILPRKMVTGGPIHILVMMMC